MKIGVIFCAYNTEDYLPDAIQPWIEARRTQLGGHEFAICAISYPFSGFDAGPRDSTQDQLREYRALRVIDGLLTGIEPVAETEARGNALRWLVEHGCTHVWQVDSDEFYTTAQIGAILRFVEARPVDWYRLCLKNLVFTPDQYLVAPFTPPRIHRVHNPGGYVAAGFYQDNNVYYERPWNKERYHDQQMAMMLVPKNVAWIRHATWLNNERSRLKIDYQLRGRGWPRCDFAWDEIMGLVWSGIPQETAVD